jgi:hypothetical protein
MTVMTMGALFPEGGDAVEARGGRVTVGPDVRERGAGGGGERRGRERDEDGVGHRLFSVSVDAMRAVE